MVQKHIRFDWAIKKLLRNKANFEILEGFLSELLMEDIFVQEILESESNKDNPYDKSNRVDILVKNHRGELMLIEIQNENEYDYFHRMNYGQAKLISENIFAGNKYSEIKKVYSINIVYFDLGQGSDYIYIGETVFKGMHDHDELALSAKQQEIYSLEKPSDIFATYYLLRLNNFDDKPENTLDEWIYFLKRSQIEDGFKAKGLQKAKEAMRIDNLNPSEKEDYENFIKVRRIRLGEIDTAWEGGKDEAKKELLPLIEQAKAREEEERKQKLELKNTLKQTIIQLQSFGMDLAQIAKMLNKSNDEINEILS
ncbi:MAG: Rpn family recombination-promoting nuclease/putative transposase [Arcicella sp.]|nr:Rpn family recombination-promoting nuclease/putative transposase [Arcicella sp.]